MKYYEKKKRSFFAGKGFYLVLAFCLVAVGAAAWSAYSAISEFGAQGENTPPISSYTEPAGVNKEDVSKESDTSSEQPVSSETKVSSVNQNTEEKTVAKYFVLPVSGNINKGFSKEKLQYSLTYNDRRLHTGIDIAAPLGTAVKSSGDGKVKSVETDHLLGVVITVDHGDGIIGRYCGLNEAVKVNEGDKVKGGQVIGAVGNIPSESVDESHLHLEFLKDDEYISPLALMGLDG